MEFGRISDGTGVSTVVVVVVMVIVIITIIIYFCINICYTTS
jgi:hypothetical protein